jgi:hypothetical protein
MRRISAAAARARASGVVRPFVDPALLNMFFSNLGPDPVCSRGRSKRTLALIEHTLAVFDEFDGSMSTRQVYYQLVSAGAVENCKADYKRVQRLLVELRRDGDVSYDRVVDRTRRKHQRAGWHGLPDILSTSVAQYRRDVWVEQPVVVMIACEKQALEGVFAEACDEFGASLWVVRGYNSESFAFEWASEINAFTDEGKRVVVSYFGDFDPSGLSIEADCQTKLRQHGAEFEWCRCGLLEQDFDRFQLVNIPVKRTDSRAARHLERFGDKAAELDALRPDVLRGRIRAAIQEHLNAELWNRLQRVEQAERDTLELVANNWKKAVEAVSG